MHKIEGKKFNKIQELMPHFLNVISIYNNLTKLNSTHQPPIFSFLVLYIRREVNCEINHLEKLHMFSINSVFKEK